MCETSRLGMSVFTSEFILGIQQRCEIFPTINMDPVLVAECAYPHVCWISIPLRVVYEVRTAALDDLTENWSRLNCTLGLGLCL